MIGFSIFYILIVAVSVTLIGLMVRASKRKILIAIFITVFGVPILFAGFLFILKGPIQEGKILKNTTLGPLLNFISPPPDLYQPLSSVNLDPGKTKYLLSFSNKYLGNHALMVSSQKSEKKYNPDYSDISVILSVLDGEKELFRMGPKKAWQFSGRYDYGAFLAWYKVPRDLPVSKELTASVVFLGDLKGFLDRRGKTTLKIQKYSDE